MQNLENLGVFEILITQKLLICQKDPFVRSALIYLSSSWCFGKVPMWRGGGGGGGAQQLQCKSESAQCSEKQQSNCEEDVGGLKFEKKMLKKQ